MISTIDADREERVSMAHSRMSYQELAAVLTELGIETVSEKNLEEMEQQYREMPAELYAALDKMKMLLAAIGRGDYDLETGEWTPDSEQIYSFDLEAFDAGNMYTIFLQRIAVISGGELEFNNISEDTGKVNYEQGTGIQTVTFELNGKTYIFEAEVNHDWYDTRILDFLNEILKQEKNGKQLYFMGDGYQECIVFYCTEKWAVQFTEKTGCELYHKTK